MGARRSCSSVSGLSSDAHGHSACCLGKAMSTLCFHDVAPLSFTIEAILLALETQFIT